MRDVVRAAFLGEENDFITDEFNKIAKIAPNKVEKLEEDEILVFPTFENDTYKIYSKKEEGYNTYYIEEDEEGAQRCECKDYLYNSDEGDYSCKHIWFLRIFMKEGLFEKGTGQDYIINLIESLPENEKLERQMNEVKNASELDIDLKEECQKIARNLN